MRLNKRTIILIFILLMAILGAFVYYFYFFKSSSDREKQYQDTQIIKPKKEFKSTSCLAEDEAVEDKIENKKRISGDSEALVQISVVDKKTNFPKYKFQIDNVRQHYHPFEIYNCGVYITRMFDYDPRKEGNQEPGYKEELWKYDYDGSGKPLILFAEKPKEFISYYSPDFRIDPLERYLVLLKGYFGSPDHALIIKDLKTLEDVFTLPMTEIEKRNPEIAQNISLDSWTRDGRYFWADTHYGAVELGFIRIDAKNWTFDIFPAPENVLGGDALNLENGYITVHPGNVWFGVEEIEQEEKVKRRKEGIGTEIYIHNLITGKRYFITKTDEPLWFFKPGWISDNELEYELPTGEKRVYEINK